MSLNLEQINTLLAQHFPQVSDEISIDTLSHDTSIVRLSTQHRHLRPGGTVSGPAMFLLADVAAYIGILAQAGDKTLAVTTSANIDFLRKPKANRDVLAHTKVIKLGKQLAVVEVYLYSEHETDTVARAALTYALPPKTMSLD